MTVSKKVSQTAIWTMEVQFPFISVVVNQTRNLPAAIFAIRHLVLDNFFLTYAVNAI